MSAAASADGTRLRRVGVQHVGPDSSDDGWSTSPRRGRVGKRRDLPLKLGNVDRRNRELLRDVLHRALSASHPSRHEGVVS